MAKSDYFQVCTFSQIVIGAAYSKSPAAPKADKSDIVIGYARNSNKPIIRNKDISISSARRAEARSSSSSRRSDEPDYRRNIVVGRTRKGKTIIVEE